MIWAPTALVINWASQAHATSNSLDLEMEKLDQAFPLYRYANAGFSIGFGAMAIWKGSEVMTAPYADPLEQTVATSLFISGIARVSLGGYRMVKPFRIENDLQIYQQGSKNRRSMVWRSIELGQIETRNHRLMSSGLKVFSGLAYLYLYQNRPEQHRFFIVPGGFLTVIGLITFFIPSPPEAAYKRLKNQANGVSVDPFLLPTGDAVQGGVKIEF